MRLLACSMVLLFAACTDDAPSGEPIEGSVTIHLGSKTITPEVGAAIKDFNDPTKLLVLIGTEAIDCKTNEQSPIKGTMLLFSITPETGPQQGFVSVAFTNASGGHLNGSSGDVTIDSIDTRVKGSVTFDTTDDEEGPITASGTFDVIKCK
jgi:hypothetical protein